MLIKSSVNACLFLFSECENLLPFLIVSEVRRDQLYIIAIFLKKKLSLISLWVLPVVTGLSYCAENAMRLSSQEGRTPPGDESVFIVCVQLCVLLFWLLICLSRREKQLVAVASNSDTQLRLWLCGDTGTDESFLYSSAIVHCQVVNVNDGVLTNVCTSYNSHSPVWLSNVNSVHTVVLLLVLTLMYSELVFIWLLKCAESHVFSVWKVRPPCWLMLNIWPGQ